MAKREIDDAEYDVLTRGMQLLNKLQSDPGALKHLERAVKTVMPEVKTSEDQVLEIAKPYVEKIDALEKKYDERFAKEDEDRKKYAEAQADRALTTALGDIRKRYALTDEGMGKITKIMQERNIPDPYAAAALFNEYNPKPTQETSSWEPSRWNFQEESVVDTKALFKDEDMWADRETGKILTEMRQQNAVH